jgi:sugar phosphate isomerase/epimerase
MARRQIFINVPYEMLLARLDFAIQNRLHPEIYFDGNALDTASREDIDRLAGVLSEQKIDVTLHGPYMDLSPGGLDPKVKEVTLERIWKTMDLAVLFRPKTVVFHPGFDPWRFEEYQGLWLKNSIEAWKPVAGKAEEIPLPQWFDLLGEFLVEVHFHDNDGARDDHLPLGDGKMDFAEFFDLLGRINPRPILAVEPHEEAHLWSSLTALEKYLS